MFGDLKDGVLKLPTQALSGHGVILAYHTPFLLVGLITCIFDFEMAQAACRENCIRFDNNCTIFRSSEEFQQLGLGCYEIGLVLGQQQQRFDLMIGGPRRPLLSLLARTCHASFKLILPSQAVTSAKPAVTYHLVISTGTNAPETRTVSANLGTDSVLHQNIYQSLHP